MTYSKKRSRESRAAIERIYITMRQFIIRGSYKPGGVSGEALKEALLALKPEIYGSIDDVEKVELDGLLYVAERLPKGIEECSIIKLIAREGFEEAGHPSIMPGKRRRNCYRIDADRMYVEMSRGRSDIYDILTHLTFLYIEGDKIMKHALDQKGRITNNWLRLKEVIEAEQEGGELDQQKALVYLSNVLGRTLAETQTAVSKFNKSNQTNSLFHFVYWLGECSVQEKRDGRKREIFFSAKLRDVIGHHVYGEAWATHIKRFLAEKDWLKRPLHIISANLHSVRNILYGFSAPEGRGFKNIEELTSATANDAELNDAIDNYAQEKGLHQLEDLSGTNLNIQIIDLKQIEWGNVPLNAGLKEADDSLLLVMDYAFGEQAFECMDELLKPFEHASGTHKMNVHSVSVMGKAGILKGNKGDIMLATAHVFEGTADNYPLDNGLTTSDFDGCGLTVHEGPMVTVLGTSLQNRDVLHHFKASTWNAIGIEMEGAHYQKAIQSASRIRKSVPENLRIYYAYYASDNPLVTGSTLSSGSLGAEGIKPTYVISQKILEKILS